MSVYVPMLVEQHPDVHIYLNKLQKRMSDLNPLLRSFKVDHHKYLDEEDDLIVILKVDILFTSPMMLWALIIIFTFLGIGYQSLLLLSLAGLVTLVMGVFFPPFWILLFNMGLKKMGCEKKARFVNWGKLINKVYDGTIRRL